LKQNASKRIDIGRKFRPESKWIWRNTPIMAREKAFGWHLASNQTRPLGGTDFGLRGLSDHSNPDVDGGFISISSACSQSGSSGRNIR
jgi:hypothetical protein